ncbi:helix loop helix DNA-binding domain protein [Ceratobasidium sp. AG-Ba]|nr:helix loop helix DNA-binding domain protein [Ceratobasidium sp. AG-Ba]
MDLTGASEMGQPEDMPELSLDFSVFDLSQLVPQDDGGAMHTHQMHLPSMSTSHSAHTSPMLNPVQSHPAEYCAPHMVTNPEVARLHHHLEQQRRLNELNQLQNRILQQQLEIMGSHPPAPVHVGAELRPTMYDPSMVQGLTNPFGNNSDLLRSLLSPSTLGPGSHPSPFPQNHGPPADIFTPIPSPALGPSPSPAHPFRQASVSAIPSPVSTTFAPLPSPSFEPSSGPSRQKRTAVSEVESARKRASPIVKPTPPTKSNTSKRTTPRTRPRGDSVAQPQPRASSLPSPHPSGTIEPVGDLPVSTPSPVDISTTLTMPPPAVPVARTPSNSDQDVTMETIASMEGTPVGSANASPSLAPVTPASLMNLGHLATRPTGLTHGTQQQKAAEIGHSSRSSAASSTRSASNISNRNKDGEQAKGAPKAKVPIAKSGTRPSPAILPMISPAIKPSASGGLTAEDIAHLSTKSNYQNALEGRAAALGIASSSGSSSYGPDGRKTSHKAAEQKRRDSLKAGFDDLRLLLPPITLSACAELDPGAAPPRGPPRNVPGGEDNPNRAVSKLALLRFSNEYIVKLGRRVDRRDQAIGDLRKEVKMLREMLQEKLELGTDMPAGCDLETDLDAIEEDKNESKLTRMASRPTENLKVAQKQDTIAEQDEEDGDEAE